MEPLPTLKGRYFNVPICVDCWDRVNPDRKATPERRQELENSLREETAGWDKGDIAANRCPVCDENVHMGIYVRVTTQLLRAMRPKLPDAGV